MKETKHKELYEAPTTDVLEVKNEGIICASGDVPGMPGYPSGGNPLGS